jgi:hypothetical protein
MTFVIKPTHVKSGLIIENIYHLMSLSGLALLGDLALGGSLLSG